MLTVLGLKTVEEAADLGGRDLPREVSGVALVLTEDQRSFNVRGLAFFREGTRVVVGGGSWMLSISISSPRGGGGGRRGGEAEMSSAFRVDAGAGGPVCEEGSSVDDIC